MQEQGAESYVLQGKKLVAEGSKAIDDLVKTFKSNPIESNKDRCKPRIIFKAVIESHHPVACGGGAA